MKYIVQRNSLSASCSNSQITSLQTFDQYLGPFLVKDICIINSLTFQVILIQLGHFWMPHPPFICSIDGVCHHCIKNVLFLLKANELNEKALPSLSRNYWNMTLQKVLNNNPNVFVWNDPSIQCLTSKYILTWTWEVKTYNILDIISSLSQGLLQVL